MSLSRFDGSNFNFWKEQMQDYLIVKGQINPIENAIAPRKKLSETYEKKVASTKMYLIWRLYNLRMKESDSVQAHLNEYESLSSQILSQGKTIEDELRAMMLMSSLPSS